MRSTRTLPDSARNRSLRRRLERWRQRRPHQRAAFPQALWAAAVMVAREHGLYPTARGLRLNYGALKAHVNRAERAAPRPTFVELVPGPPRPVSECVIELEGPQGTTRVRVSGLAVAEVVALARGLGGRDA